MKQKGKKMNDVCLLETIYPCWAYALARVGHRDLLTLEWIEKDMQGLLNDYRDNILPELKSGDILVWNNVNPEKIYSPVNIQNNEIIFEKIFYNYHVCVYEGSGLVTDLVEPDGNAILPFIIRKRKLAQLSRPDFFIRFEEEE